jgi:hypothetical protein
VKIAAIADLHCGKSTGRDIREVFTDLEKKADILVMAGDLTNVGLVEEMERLISLLEAIALPKIAVLGNHDHQNDENEMLVKMMEGSGICVLDCTSCVIDGVGFVGTKGFCGGFGELRIQPLGEQAIKEFVRNSIDEAVRVENALNELDTRKRIAILHYAPVKETLTGEPPELFPFLGSSLIADALNRHRVDVVFHGHAHHGSPEGRTAAGIPVYNVCRFVQQRFYNRDYMIYET